MCIIETNTLSSCFWSLEKTGEAHLGLEQTNKQFFWYQEFLTIEGDIELIDSQAFLLRGVRLMG